MNGVVAFLIALLLYPGIIAALVAAWALSWTRDIVRTSLGSGMRPGPLSVVSELRAAFARETLAPAGVEVAFQAIIPVLAVAAPLTALVLLPLPGNPLISGLGLTGDLVAEGCLLFAVPVLRLLTGWATPSPYTRLAADRGARLVAGCGLPVALALSALAQQLGTLEIGPVVAPSTTSLAPLAVVARLLAAAAFACCLPVLARMSSLREGDGDVDLAAGELSEASGRDLAAWRLAEGQDAREDVAVAKYWAGEGGHFATYAAQHLHGGIGLDVDYPLHRYFLWSKQIELSLGSSVQHLARLGAAMAEAGSQDL